tara:strand:+ start:223 stop:390 length:168 start_codon:yes stop_codon:yes gene_type:complete
MPAQIEAHSARARPQGSVGQTSILQQKQPTTEDCDLGSGLNQRNNQIFVVPLLKQ